MALTRRAFLATTAAATASLGWTTRASQRSSAARLFQHGVASGDALHDRVILWTRVTPAASRSATGPIDVTWRIATDPKLTQIAGRGVARTAAARDFTVKVDAGGLEPGRTYYYRFEAGGEASPIGRTKTLPASDVARMRIASVSCSNYPAGYFNVYRCVANRPDLDAVVHLGDYIYEFENGRYGDGTALGRLPVPARESVTLDDYRQRYALYRTDPDLQEAHRQHLFITVWDDHELANNAWRDGAQNHDPAKGEGDWSSRRAAAWQAHLEWMPVRDPQGRNIRLYRTFSLGTLADLVMLDTRALRDVQVPADDLAGVINPRRTLLGGAQEAWLFDELRASQQAGVRWRMLGQQVLFARMSPEGQRVRNADSWDGYQGARDRVVSFLESERIRDVAVLTGDVHSAWGMDIPKNPWSGYNSRTGEGSFGVEIVTPAVSSPPPFTDQARERAAALKVMLPHLRHMDGAHRGFVVVDITRERLQADWFTIPTVLERSAEEGHAASLVCEHGSSHFAFTDKPSRPTDAAPPAP